MSFWIRTASKPQKTHFYYFKKDIDLSDIDPLTVINARMRVCADSRYRLYVNDTFVGEGPCQGSEYTRYFETFTEKELLPLLNRGRNNICLKVLHLEENSFISVYKMSRPAIWVDGEILYRPDRQPDCQPDRRPDRQPDHQPDCEDVQDNTAKFTFGSDESWTCDRDDSVTFRHFPGIHVSVPPGEEQNGASKLTRVDIEQFASPSPGGYNIFGLADVYPLEERIIPQLQYGEIKEFSLARKGDMPDGRRFEEYDAGIYTTALPILTLEGEPGAEVKVLYSESYLVRGENGGFYKGPRDAVYTDPEAAFSGEYVYYDVVRIPESGRAEFTPFWYRAFRFVRLEISGRVNVFRFAYQPYFYPFPKEGFFRSSDNNLDKMWEVSVNTVKCCAHEIYIDCPYYEQQEYDMDSCLEMLFTQRMISDPRLPLKGVTDLARSQIFNGMLQANYPSTMTQIIPDFTLFWIIMLREFIRYAPANGETVRQASSFLGTVDKALESFEIFRDRDNHGLFGANPYWDFVDWVPGWMAGITPGGPEGEPLTVSSMIFTAALRNAAEIAEYCGRRARAAEYRERAEAMAATIREYCFDKEAGLFRNTPARREFSQHTSLWAVLAEIVAGDEAKELLERTLDDRQDIARCSFSMGFFLFRAIEKAGIYDKYAPKLLTGWQRMLDNHCTTWCENPDSPRSECHGWSSAPSYELSAMVLGAFPAENGYKKLRIRPHLFVLDTQWAEGAVPTPYGTVNIALRRESQAVNENLPDEQKLYSIKVELPDGRIFSKDGCVDGEEFMLQLG